MSMRARTADITGNKIVILISVFQRGGAERQSYLLARELRQRHGLNIEVWALKFPGDYAKEFEAVGVPTKVLGFVAPGYIADGVKLLHVPPRVLAFQDPVFPLRWARRLRRVVHQLNDGGADILLPFTTWPNVIAGLTYRLAGVRLCIWGSPSPRD